MEKIIPPDWKPWPPFEQLETLCKNADGLFHYAVTALGWIEQQIENRGTACQDWVMKGLTQEGGLNLLDTLYRVILTSWEGITENSDERTTPAQKLRHKNRLCGFQHVIGTILVLQKPLTIAQITALLADIPRENFDVKIFLKQFHSVLVPGTTAIFEDATPQMHKSFRDYIMDERAPTEFRILTGHAHFLTARSCLGVIVNSGSQPTVAVEYSVAHWYEHLRKAVEGKVEGDSNFWDEGGIWDLFKRMKEDTVVDVWKPRALAVFRDVAAAGWKLLQRVRVFPLSTVLASLTVPLRAFPLSHLLALLTTPRLLISSKCEVCAFPLSHILASLTPYPDIWENGLLETWKQKHQTLLSSSNPTPKDQEDRS
ncbi:hypothetical protein GGX14DRAFT_536832 [Mycena pura]|uniref:Uncharacterized protein n=1 Tax=Mycena pura TaxID=153505 RepID=A0AAD6V0U8_9AGAR|nr:hypothetical protein GGX14DRAFT_536832 [Mycena pura]